mmetsp:Transcript_39481/g.84228  ORF Transcript_39481/g.84228 Transcript_39481/m.84228 type:complete len:471 (-) Transcript_39481:598-2010(-)|eukprot:CAMPEP_0206474422 /NCGR_PEP_ID=MMETSP0324_2-20121206/33477_1 /ASSEMBLY_ACC=CAM_ASM_000836 /TAXON_ID=2866 /ORGANISM="Crypthecodinium cohnii, Strain Seligo" /LENGTH=470 /DNA_ID=CAMNT_0053949591 /DNA_START=93 /DNA_END=1505 /DNA_ORIENTATION=+
MATMEQQVATENSLPEICLQAIPFTIKNTFVDVGPSLHAEFEGDLFAAAEEDLGLRRLVSEPALKRRVSECFVEKPAASSSDEDDDDCDSVDLNLACEAWGRFQTEDRWEHEATPARADLTFQAQTAKLHDTMNDDDDVDLELEQSSWARLTTGENWAECSEESDDCTQSSFGPSCSDVDPRLSPEQGCQTLSLASLTTASASACGTATLCSSSTLSEASSSPTPVNWASVHSVLLQNVPAFYTTEMLQETFAAAGFGVSVVSVRRLRPQEETVRVEFVAPNQAWLFKCTFEGKVLMSLGNQTISQPLQVQPCQGARLQQQQPQQPEALLLPPPSPQQSPAIATHRSLGDEETGASASKAAAAASLASVASLPGAGQSLSLGALPLLPRRRRKGMGSLIDIAKAQQMAASGGGASGAAAAPVQQAQAAAAVAAPVPPASGKFAVCTGCGAKCKVIFKFCSYCGAQMPSRA